jgi:hypothetical protein
MPSVTTALADARDLQQPRIHDRVPIDALLGSRQQSR